MNETHHRMIAPNDEYPQTLETIELGRRVTDDLWTENMACLIGICGPSCSKPVRTSHIAYKGMTAIMPKHSLVSP